jgi:hypothetical protein
MSSITKNQTALALVVVAFATIMIAGTIALSADSAFAKKVVVVKQSHNQHQHQTQTSSFATSGLTSGITGSLGNLGVQAQTNDGGSTANIDNSDNSE